jgi:hypothetical protein
MPPVKLILPDPHQHQAMFVHWKTWFPHSQVLIAPCGTKFGKSFGCSLWLAKEAWSNPGLYCAWIAPTYLKARIGYRYLKCLLDIPGETECVDGKLEIKFKHGSYIKFLHGKDAEITVEGENIDRFVIDESGKQSKQLWFSLFTTITQTKGLGIVTGTPRGFTWYYDEFRKAKNGDPFYCWATLRTADSPFVDPESIQQARRLLPKHLFEQYYEAVFVSNSTVFGDLSKMFCVGQDVSNETKFWIHPDPAVRSLDTVTGWDIAKHRDYSVFFTTNIKGDVVGYARFRQVPYEIQVDRLKYYLHTYFLGDRILRYDATGVGDAVGEMIAEKDIDASICPVVFSNKSKQEMVNRLILASDAGFIKCPRIEQVMHEFGAYEVNVTKSGLYTYSAPDGDHDDCVSAAMLSISGAHQLAATEESEKLIEKAFTEFDLDENSEDEITETASVLSGDDNDDFFDDEAVGESFDDFTFQ